MSYPHGRPITYMGISTDFGAGTGTAWSIKGPKGKVGRIVDIGVTHISEAFACDSTEAAVLVGTSGDADANAKLNITDGTAATDVFNTVDDTDAIINEFLDADTQYEVTHVQSVDGSAAAGIAYPYVVVEWYD